MTGPAFSIGDRHFHAIARAGRAKWRDHGLTAHMIAERHARKEAVACAPEPQRPYGAPLRDTLTFRDGSTCTAYASSRCPGDLRRMLDNRQRAAA